MDLIVDDPEQLRNVGRTRNPELNEPEEGWSCWGYIESGLVLMAVFDASAVIAKFAQASAPGQR